MRNIIFQNDSFKEFLEWSEIDRKKYLKLGKLINEIVRNPFDGS